MLGIADLALEGDDVGGGGAVADEQVVRLGQPVAAVDGHLHKVAPDTINSSS